MISVATVFAQQAKDAGVTVNVKNIPGDAYWSDYYIKSSFAYLLGNMGLPSPCSVDPGARRHVERDYWPPKTGKGSTTFMELYHKALAEFDETKRMRSRRKCSRSSTMKVVISSPSFREVRWLRRQPAGRCPDQLTWGLRNFGHGFRSFWFDWGGAVEILDPWQNHWFRHPEAVLAPWCCASRSLCSRATQALGDPARAILGRDATPERLAASPGAQPRFFADRPVSRLVRRMLQDLSATPLQPISRELPAQRPCGELSPCLWRAALLFDSAVDCPGSFGCLSTREAIRQRHSTRCRYSGAS